MSKMFNKYYSDLQNIKIFPDIFLGIFLCLVFAGCFFLDTSPHRICLYITFVSGLFFVNSKQSWHEAFLIKDSLFLMTIAFIGYTLLSLFWSENMDYGDLWGKIKPAIFIPLSIVLYAFYIKSYPAAQSLLIELFLLSAAITATILLIISINEIITPHTNTLTMWRLEGFGRAHNSNLAGLLYGVALLCFLFFKPKALAIFHNKLFRIFCILVVTAAFTLTLSRGAFIGFIGAFILSICVKLYTTKNIDRKAIALTVVTILSLSFALIVVFPDITEYMVNRGATGRIEIWMMALEQYKESPWIGRGIGTEFTYNIPHPYLPISVGHVHSLYFSTLLHLGIIGSVLFLTLLVSVWFRAAKYAITTQDYTLLLIISYGYVFGLVDFGGYYKSLSNSWIVFWIPVAILIARQEIHMKSKQNTL
ncbi:MAG: hypothetical protein COA45_07935 [Zetaproteobacteria bacterium]|nr:MAG: hypothetical protein COA45_07935 [Zetaproteobacteria bacterium]